MGETLSRMLHVYVQNSEERLGLEIPAETLPSSSPFLDQAWRIASREVNNTWLRLIACRLQGRALCYRKEE